MHVGEGVDIYPCCGLPALAGRAPRALSPTGSRRSLSPNAVVTFNRVARVGLPPSDSAS